MSRGKGIGGVGLLSLVLLGVLAALAQTAEKPPTELYVRTSPPGAAITVDGKDCGSSPALFEVEPGEHTITVKLEGHRPKTRAVTVPEGRIRRVILELQKGPEARVQQPEAGGAAWGQPVEGVQCRIRAEKPTWPQGTVPKLLADLRNRGQRNLRIAIESESWEIEIDGKWHKPDTGSSGDRNYLPLGPGAEQQNLEVWIPDVDNLAQRLRELPPGKHTLRVARLLNSSRAPGEEILRLVSNAIEIEIVLAEARPKAPDQEPAWGKQVENLQCRIRAEKAAWTAGTVPKLFGDLRVYDMLFPALATASENWEIEIDGKWHKNQRAKLQGSHGGKVIFLSWPATEHWVQEAVYQLAIDAEQSAARSLRALAPGKHVLRAGYQFGALPPDTAKTMSIILEDGMGPHRFSRSGKAVHVVSNPIEIEIVAPEPTTPPIASGQPRLSPSKLMSASLGADVGVLAVAFSPSGKTVAAVDEAGQVMLRNARAGTQTMSFNLLTAQEREAIFRSAKRQKILTGGIAFSPDGARLAVGGGPVVKLYDAASGRPDLTFVDKRLVVAPSPPAPLPASGARGESLSKPAAVPYAHGTVFCVAFSPDGTLLATSGDVVREVGEDTGATPGHLKLWDVKTGELKRDLGDYYPSVRSVAFSPDGKTLASIGTHPPEGTSSVRLWDPQTGTVKSVLPIARGGIPWSVAFSPDGKLVAASALVNEDDRSGRQGERGCKLLVWNARTGAPLCNRPVPGLALLSFSADSQTLAAGVDGRGVTLWDPETLKPKGEIQPSTDLPRGITGSVPVAFSPTGSLLAVGAEDAKHGFITVWEIGQPGDPPAQTTGW